MTNEQAQAIADEVLSLYQQYGDEDYIGEPVSQTEHMHQCAMLAEKAGYGEEITLAAFFHDIGHFCEHLMPVTQMDGYGIVDHEKLGAEYLLSKGFSQRIASLVENHVQAKRYLTYADTTYYEQLSDASRMTLTFQGGRMTKEEAMRFQNDDLFNLHLLLRRWDEQAKIVAKSPPALDKYRSMIVRHLQNSNL